MEKILIIDDERFTQQIINKSLVSRYNTRTADNGICGLKIAEEWQPDIILLDVEMPGQNGYEVCDALKQNKSTCDIPVVFLSANGSLREKMLGFEVGAEDYLLKSCDRDLMIAKLDKISEVYHQRNEYKHTASDAEKTALEAMSSNFELGKAVRFVERSHDMSTFDQLGHALCETIRQLDLKACVMFRVNEDILFYSSTMNSITPIESDVMTTLHREDRFVDFGCRTQCNYPSAAILIKNMPLDDRPRYGRIKDILPFVLGAADAKLRVLDAEQSLLKQNRGLAESVETVKRLLEGISSTLKGNHQAVSEIMMELTAEINLYINALSLDQDQEDFVLEKVDSASKKLYVCVVDGDSVVKALNEILVILRSLGIEQARIISESFSNSSDYDFDSNDVELF